MAVQEQTPLQEYTANGITKQFDLEFDCESADHLIVSIDDLEVLHTDWYLSGNAIMFHVAPANGKQVKIQRNTPFNRLADYQSYNNSFRPPAINKDFDRIWWKLQELGVADWILSNRISALKAYVDDRDDELRAYLLEEIRKQGVALDQLDEYYNYLMQRLAQIAVDKGWDASFVVDESGKTQQEINGLLIDPMTKEGVMGDGQFRPITDLWTAGTASYRFASRAAAEVYLGFNITSELVDVGLNSSVDTAYLQKYIIAASSKFISTGEPTTLKLKSSATYIITGLQLYPGVNLISDGQTEFKKRPALDITSEAILKWWRIATCKGSAFTSEAATKHRNIIDGIKFNGNMLDMNWTYNTYNQEQGSSLTITSANGSVADIRAKFNLRNLVFVDSVSDGLHVVRNSDVIYSNLEAQNCFRGGLVITGGNSIVRGEGMVSNNARADIEIDSTGFGGSRYLYCNIKNYFQDIGGKIGDFIGGCDLGGVGGSEFYFENFNVHTSPTNILTGDGAAKAKSFVFKNGTLTLGAGSSEKNRIINPIGMLFENTTFRILDGGFLSIYTYFNNYLAMQDYKFKDCKTEFLGTTLAAQVFKIESQPVASTGNMIIEGGDYSATPTQNLVRHTLGGKTKLDNVKHAVSSAIVYRRITTGYPSIVEFNKFNQQSTAVDLYAIESSIAATENQTIFNADSVMPSSLNMNTTNSVGLLKNKRTVFSDTTPTVTTRSFVGDRFVLNSPDVGKPFEWVATTTSNTASSYRATKWLVGSFPTTSLPLLTEFDVGCQNIDSTLNKVVTWTGSAWI